jgi:hypothetical protein
VDAERVSEFSEDSIFGSRRVVGKAFKKAGSSSTDSSSSDSSSSSKVDLIKEDSES